MHLCFLRSLDAFIVALAQRQETGKSVSGECRCTVRDFDEEEIDRIAIPLEAAADDIVFNRLAGKPDPQQQEFLPLKVRPYTSSLAEVPLQMN